MKFDQNKIRKYTRILHRDIGYLLVGLTLIYGISGIILVLKKHEKDPAYREVVIEKQISKDLSKSELEAQWSVLSEDAPKLTRIFEKDDEYNFYVEGGLGHYNPATGQLAYKVYEEREFVKFVNEIHYNSGKRFTWLGIAFAGAFLFLAVSGLIIVKGKNGFLRRGIYLVLIGILIPVLWYVLT